MTELDRYTRQIGATHAALIRLAILGPFHEGEDTAKTVERRRLTAKLDELTAGVPVEAANVGYHPRERRDTDG